MAFYTRTFGDTAAAIQATAAAATNPNAYQLDWPGIVGTAAGITTAALATAPTAGATGPIDQLPVNQLPSASTVVSPLLIVGALAAAWFFFLKH